MRAKKNKKIEYKYSLLSDKSPFALKEAFGLLRTNILYMPVEGEGGRVIALTSAEEASGKSTIATNLALTFARTSKKTVLIDADMRCPRQHKFFNFSKNPVGLSEYLAGIKSLDDILLRGVKDGLDIIPSGHVPPSPAELILSSRFGQLIDDLKKEYDFIVIDFPPIGIVSDAASVSKLVNGYLFVVRENHSDSSAVKEAIQKLENVDAVIIGIVMNEVSYKSSIRGKKYASRYAKYDKQHPSNNVKE